MKNQPIIHEKVHFIGITYLALVPVLALLLSLVPMHSNANMDLPFLSNELSNKVLVFAGFADCNSSCPVSLQVIQQAYSRYQEITRKNDLHMLFVNIKLDTPEEISYAYAKSFHEDFKAYSIKSEDASHLYKTLSLKTFASNQKNINHRGLIYLFSTTKNKWKLERIFNDEISQEKIIAHLLKHTA